MIDERRKEQINTLEISGKLAQTMLGFSIGARCARSWSKKSAVPHAG